MPEISGAIDLILGTSLPKRDCRAPDSLLVVSPPMPGTIASLESRPQRTRLDTLSYCLVSKSTMTRHMMDPTPVMIHSTLESSLLPALHKSH